MTTRGRSGVFSLSGLVSVLILYLVMIGVVLTLFAQTLGNLDFVRSPVGVFVAAIGLAFTVFLVVSVFVGTLRLLRDRAERRPGARFKSRLLGFFVIVIVLAAIPQGALSVTMLSTAASSWFSQDTGDALESGLEIALEYNQRVISDMEHLLRSSTFRAIVRDLPKSPPNAWRQLQDIAPEVRSFQVFGPAGTEIFSAGRREAFVTSPGTTGTVDRVSEDGLSFVRASSETSLGDASYRVYIASFLPDQFDARARGLTDANEEFSQFDSLGGVFTAAVVIFFGIFSVPLILLSIMASFVLSDEIIRPLTSLEEATRRVAEGDFSYRILSREQDELGLLTASFNKMVGELSRSRTKLLQTEKLTAWQEIAQRLAHEIKNPLTPIRLASERMLRKYRNDPDGFADMFERSVASILSEVENISAMLTEFRDFSRLPHPVPEDVHLKPLIDEARESYATDVDTIIHSEDVDPDIHIQADRSQLKQVFGNLFKNAIEAMLGTGEIYVRTELVQKVQRLYCRIQVQDNGPGIPADQRQKVFEPYHTTKLHGTGLGLSIVERIIFDHKGEIWFETAEEQGTTFLIDLPVVQGEDE